MSIWHQVVIAILGVFASARITRLLVNDEYPPSIWLRMKWDALTHDGSWSKLAHCPWCLAPYVTAAVFGVGYLVTWPTWWYLGAAWMSASWAAAWITFHDED